MIRAQNFDPSRALDARDQDMYPIKGQNEEVIMRLKNGSILFAKLDSDGLFCTSQRAYKSTEVIDYHYSLNED